MQQRRASLRENRLDTRVQFPRAPHRWFIPQIYTIHRRFDTAVDTCVLCNARKRFSFAPSKALNHIKLGAVDIRHPRVKIITLRDSMRRSYCRRIPGSVHCSTTLGSQDVKIIQHRRESGGLGRLRNSRRFKITGCTYIADAHRGSLVPEQWSSFELLWLLCLQPLAAHTAVS